MRIFYFMFILLSFSYSIKACDICGCGIGNMYFGIMPKFNDNMLSVRYRYQKFQHQETPLSYNAGSKVLYDTYRTTELFYRYVHPDRRLQFFAVLPYKYNERVDESSTHAIHGIGDMVLITNYIFYNTADSMSRKFKVTLQTGLGLKMPLGKYQQRSINRTMYPVGFQAGNGAWAYQFNGIATFRYNQLGWNNELQYIINTTNELEYKQGNRVNISSSLFYWKKIKAVSHLFTVGVMNERTAPDQQFGFYNNQKGGVNVLTFLGYDFFYRNYSVGINYTLPYAYTNNDMPVLNHQVGFQLSYFY